VHFVSCPADGAKGHPIGLGELRPRQFGLDEIAEGRDRETDRAAIESPKK
jgi:hypothetical protein